uniref:RNA-directed DNA polymerase n=1 Tax=Tanacetum cinerariifolium TaxID=118510 RepID=A0A699JX71_TANCI|nr:DNA-directed DNA polymerase [Tanacetum cinerariifolium]
MIRAVRINVPLIDVLVGMPNYGKFLKELIRNKHRIEQIFTAFLSDESSAMIQNKVPPKLRDPKSFLIPCNFTKTFSCNALVDLGLSINLMPYSLYAKLSLETLKPTKMSVRLADRSFQCLVGIAENMVVEVDEGSEILYSIEGTLLEEEIFIEFDEFVATTVDENFDFESDTEERPFVKIIINTVYKIKTSLEEPHTDLELKPLPDNLKYVFLEEPSFLPVIISSQLSKGKKKNLCMLAIFHDMIEESVEVFMDDFSVFWNSFEKCLKNLDKMLQRCKDAHLVLNWEKCHFIVKEGIVLGHKVSSVRLEVDKAKINVISKLPPPTNSKGAVLGQKDGKNFHPIYFASKTLNPAQQKYTVTEKELMAVVFAFDKFRSCLILSKTVVHTDHSALRHLFKKQDAKPRLDRWILLLQEFDIEIKDRKGTENVAADHLSRIDESSDDSEVDDNFPGETPMEINTQDEPWFVDFANYLVANIILKRMTYQQKNIFFSNLKHYFWEEPYLFKVCFDSMIRCCISGSNTQTILDQCHHGPTGGHYGLNATTKKVLDLGFY